MEDDLAPTDNGYKPGEKKTLQELAELDKNDESLNKWKASLGVDGKATSEPGKVIIEALVLQVAGRQDIRLDLSSDAAIKEAALKTFTIKEGCEYRLKVVFRVINQVVSGLKYLHSVKRKGIRVDKFEYMIGSYGPSEEAHARVFPPEEAPSGMLARGHYNVKSKFIDDDQNSHIEWEWSFQIAKDWE